MNISTAKKLLLGFNLKDTITNISGLVGLCGTLLSIAAHTGTIPKKYMGWGECLLGSAVVVNNYVSGKRGDLKGGQIDMPVLSASAEKNLDKQ